MLLTWTDDLAIGIDEIDGHHKYLVSVVNALDEASRRGEGKAVLGSILAQLADYIGFHFTREEHHMRVIGYPALEEHHEQHDALMQQLSVLVHDYETGKTTVTQDTLVFLKDWLMNHLLGHDRRIGAFLKARTEQAPP